ncbi:ATP-dependent DNA helicase PIF1 [Eumeta japonica]|uniref:ATP-dependent DNA helicase n=1 Tax=Eumeta variegata TaxID=151549 RepID=A0A4C1XL39_EUMVA|nr:ATP-dependent DNA helicase PIF1 [Eumeta japonica]
MLHEVNPYVRSFKAAIDSIPQGQNNNYKVIIKADRRPAEEHRGRYKAPVVDEVAVILVDQECDRRDIVLRSHDDRLQRICETHRSYDALQYSLIYFHGLFSQFIVDMYAKIETERLIYIRTNQTRLRAEDYVHLRDAMQQDNNVENVGRLVILPSSFIGGPRYMHERTQDAFCYVQILPVCKKVIALKISSSSSEQTISGENGYPLYRRKSPQHGGFTAKIRLRGQEIDLDNRWVMPYSPVLSRTFQAHINVEVCNSVQSIKYICKYVNKGSDQATVGFTNNNNDEVTRFQSGRYISSSEAVWRILSFPIHERHPPVIHLDIHLEGGQRIYFNPENVTERLESPRRTTLLAFFNLCETDAFAKTLLYHEVPSFYTYNKQQGFTRCIRITPNAFTCAYFCMSFEGLLHLPSSERLIILYTLHTKRLAGHVTYWMGINTGMMLWDEASISESPQRLRNLFAVMLVFCALSDAALLWHKYQNKLAEDFFRYAQLNNDHPISDITRESYLNRCLLAIQDIVTSIGGNPISQYGMPEPLFDGERINRDYAMEINYDPVGLAEIVQIDVPRLTEEQRLIFNRVCRSVDTALGEMLFLDAPGGTGKTFLTKVILAKVRGQGKIALAVASSGIAATLLPGGKTAHTMFKIPIDLDRTENPVCNISRNSNKAKVLRDCSLIIWDECTMANRKAIEALDRTLRDIKRNGQTMGGITILFFVATFVRLFR